MNSRFITFLVIVLMLQMSNAVAQNTFPKWLLKLYAADTTKVSAAAQNNFPDLLAPKSVHITFFRQLSDSVSYCIYTADDGVCKFNYLATQRNHQRYNNLQLADNCKIDASSIQYATTSYSLDSLTNTIITKRLSETAMDNYLTNDGQFRRYKPGYSRNNAGMLKDSTIKQVHIFVNGQLEEHKVRK